MFNSSEQGDFGQRLRRALGEAGDSTATAPNNLQQWLEYWNDAESVGANLRKVEHWLQRARTQQN